MTGWKQSHPSHQWAPICSPGADKASAYFHPHRRPFVLTLEWRLMLLGRCCCCCSCCGRPLCIPTPRSPPWTNRSGFFQANLSLSQRRWRQPKCVSRGVGGVVRGAEKEGFIHCLPLQCGGCCCSGVTPGRPFHSFSVIFPQTRRWGPLRLWRWMAVLVYPWVRCLWEYISLWPQELTGCVSPCGYKRAITVQAEVTSLPHCR